MFGEDERRALQIMDEELLATPQRWMKGAYSDFRGGVDTYCLAGARVEAATRIAPGYYGLLNKNLRDLLNDCIADITPLGLAEVNYNDDPQTTFEDIKRVIACAREKVS